MKNKTTGITKEGKETNKLFCDITGFFMSPPNDKERDAYKIINDKVCSVEIKKDTHNQVRPYKYNTVVGYDTYTKTWYVIPPDEVILNHAYGKRGQHTTDPIECCNMSKVSSKKFSSYIVEEKHLEDAVIKAYLQGEKNVLVKNYALSLREEYESIPDKRKKEIEILKETIDAQTTKQRLS